MDESFAAVQLSLMTSFQSAFKSNSLLFQMVDLFPMPVEVFLPDGTVVYGNRAALSLFNVSGLDQVVGIYNLLKDPVVNDLMGLREYVQRAFQGETISVSDIRVPLEDMAGRYDVKNEFPDIVSIYQDIFSFPLRDDDMGIQYIVNVFITKNLYYGRQEIVKAKDFIEAHWQEPIDISNMAQSVHLSRYHFIRLFKKHTGMTPYEYYQDVKVRKLKEKLRDKFLSVSEAFAACGLTYNGTYASMFKEKTGMTPSQFRKSDDCMKKQ
jgi:AraC-like DNA-binding protein